MSPDPAMPSALQSPSWSDAPSSWICRFAASLAPGASVLDVACGTGRHMAWLAARGCRVTGVDRDASVLAQAAHHGSVVQVDLEDGSPWPLTGQVYDAVLVTHYLWRPLFPHLLASVRPGGMLLYETFAAGHGRIGRPARPEFLLRPGELLQMLAGEAQHWRVLAYEDGLEPEGRRVMQRLAARRMPAGIESADLPLELMRLPA